MEPSSTLAPMRTIEPVGRELAGIRQQVDEDLDQALLIADQLGQRFGQVDRDVLAALREDRAHELDRIAHHRLQRKRLAPDAELASLDAHALEQVVDEPHQTERAALEILEQLPLLRAGHFVDAVVQQLDRGELRRERRAELVRDVGEHGIARAPHRLELGLVADHLHLLAFDGRGAR